MHHIDILQRIATLAYEGRASRKPKAFLRQIPLPLSEAQIGQVALSRIGSTSRR